MLLAVVSSSVSSSLIALSTIALIVARFTSINLANPLLLIKLFFPWGWFLLGTGRDVELCDLALHKASACRDVSLCDPHRGMSRGCFNDVGTYDLLRAPRWGQVLWSKKAHIRIGPVWRAHVTRRQVGCWPHRNKRSFRTPVKCPATRRMKYTPLAIRDASQ
jgi:hypothetical protein